jgi:hypothetical protein
MLFKNDRESKIMVFLDALRKQISIEIWKDFTDHN